MERLNEFSDYCFENYLLYKNNGFTKYTQHRELLELIKIQGCYKTELGKSVEGREINCIKLGKGETKIMAWSQMHGDESTATGALLDIIIFFTSKHKKEIAQYVDKILNACTFYFIPMLNPDGAAEWQRRNAWGIDLNRDALMQVSPEAKILAKACEDIKPHFGFNLHDQGNCYTAGLNNNPATISLLAPPYNDPRNVNSTRKKAIECVCAINRMLQKYIPDSVGKWDDDYEERAFGEYFQSKKISTILIESGAYPNDPERAMARKLNFVALLHSLLAISLNILHTFDSREYSLIPKNKKRLFDVILKDAEIKSGDKIIVCDIALREYQKMIDGEIKTIYKVEDLGDLENEIKFTSSLVYKNTKAILNKNNTLTILGLESEGLPSSPMEFIED